MSVLQLYGYELEIPGLGIVLGGDVTSRNLSVNAVFSYDVAATPLNNADSEIAVLTLSGGGVVSDTLHVSSPVMRVILGKDFRFEKGKVTSP
jgi:hypothetical protein